MRKNASGDIKNVISEIEGTLTDMDGDMNKLGAAWEGSEQEEYQQIHGKMVLLGPEHAGHPGTDQGSAGRKLLQRFRNARSGIQRH